MLSIANFAYNCNLRPYLMSELVLDGASSIDLKAFNPGRFMRRADKRGKKMKGVSVGEQW